jgi:hypothetical protein
MIDYKDVTKKVLRKITWTTKRSTGKVTLCGNFITFSISIAIGTWSHADCFDLSTYLFPVATVSIRGIHTVFPGPPVLREHISFISKLVYIILIQFRV